MRIGEAFNKMAEYGAKLGVKNICDFEGAWIQRVDDQWTFALNGKDETLEVQPDENTMAVSIPFGNAAVWFNGWLAAMLDMSGGAFIAGREANEDMFIEALDRAIAKAA